MRLTHCSTVVRCRVAWADAGLSYRHFAPKPFEAGPADP
jgi:hypothetical protein